MCGPAAAIGAVAGVGQALAGYQAEVAGVNYRNKAKLKNFERQNVQYLTDAMLANAQYKQDQLTEDASQDQEYLALINQWRENDNELDKIFSKGHRGIETATREMYEQDYAGTMTGATAARLAGKSTQEMGFKKSEYIAEMFLAEKDKVFKDESARDRSQWRSWELYEKVRYAPIHGHAPVAPLLEAKPSMAGALFGAVGSIAGGFGGEN